MPADRAITAETLKRAMARNLLLIDELRKTEPSEHANIYTALIAHARSVCPEAFGNGAPTVLELLQYNVRQIASTGRELLIVSPDPRWQALVDELVALGGEPIP